MNSELSQKVCIVHVKAVRAEVVYGGQVVIIILFFNKILPRETTTRTTTKVSLLLVLIFFACSTSFSFFVNKKEKVSFLLCHYFVLVDVQALICLSSQLVSSVKRTTYVCIGEKRARQQHTVPVRG